MCTASQLIIHLCTFSSLWKRKALQSLGSACNLRLQFIGQAAPEQSILKAGGAQAGKKLLATTLKSGFLNVKYSHLFKWRWHKSMEALTELVELEWGILGLGISSLLKVHQLVSKHALTVKQEPQNPLPWQFPRSWGARLLRLLFWRLHATELQRSWTFLDFWNLTFLVVVILQDRLKRLTSGCLPSCWVAWELSWWAGRELGTLQNLSAVTLPGFIKIKSSLSGISVLVSCQADLEPSCLWIFNCSSWRNLFPRH